ncbi:MAG: DUF885 family protein [bacterium]
MRILVLTCLLIYSHAFSQQSRDLQKLAADFFSWRAVTQPATHDDVNRVERPDGWAPDYSPEAIKEYKSKYVEFSRKLNAIPKSGWTRADSVDYLLLRSAIERVNWELNVLRLPQRSADFYINQTFGALYELLLIHSPMTAERARNIIVRMQSFPNTLEHARQNLTEPVLAFTEIALANARNPRQRLQRCADALKKMMNKSFHAKLDVAVDNGSSAMEDFIKWLEDKKSQMSNSFSIGRQRYEYFLKKIALLPFSPDHLLLMGQQEWNRSVAFDLYENLRNINVPKAELFASAQDQINQSRDDEKSIRQFLEKYNIMSVPKWVQHYINITTPPHVLPFTNMGVVDDLTSESRLHEDGVSYIPEPSPNLSFFKLARAQDPRPIIVHEGVPGHYFQLVRSWANPNPIRRRYFDSGSIEGIGFYVEELMLQFGLFDDRPHTREIIYRFMRLRALRVDVDVNLALGNYSIEDAANYLAATVPMDFPTALFEAGFFALTPGQAISYQIGKLQILNLIADARIKLGDKFRLRDYHDYMMQNGNVPIALQRWEHLGLRDELEKLWD